MTKITPATAFKFYTGKTEPIGRNAAAGIVGVLNFESGLDSTVENNSGSETPGSLNPKGSYGFAQWNGKRQDDLAAFAKAKDLDVTDPTTQLLFVLTECANSYPTVWAAIQADMPIADFVPLFVNTYERPKNPAPEIAGALATAQALLLAVPAPVVTATTPMPAPIATNAPPASAPVPAVPYGPDPEIAALEQLYAILLPFAPAARSRMVTYLTGRLSQ